MRNRSKSTLTRSTRRRPQGFTVIDVREPEELADGRRRAQSARHIPMRTLLHGDAALDPNGRYLFVCATASAASRPQASCARAACAHVYSPGGRRVTALAAALGRAPARCRARRTCSSSAAPRPTGPRAWKRSVEMPISAPMPNSPPSANCVEALCSTMALSTSRRKRSAAAAFARHDALGVRRAVAARCARSPRRRHRPRARR